MEQNEQSNKITAIYCRTAAKDAVAIERQREVLIHYADAHGFEDVKVFEDDGFSGLNPARPAFVRMNALIAEGRVTRVLTQKISRLGRDTAAVLAWTRITQKHRVEVITQDMGPISDLFATMQDIFERACLHTKNTAQPN